MTTSWVSRRPDYPVRTFLTAIGGGRYQVWNDEVSPPTLLATEGQPPSGVGLTVTYHQEGNEER